MFSKLKRNARLAMSKNWSAAIGIILIALAVELVIGLFLMFANYALNGGFIMPRNPTMEQLNMLAMYLSRMLGVQLVRVFFVVFLIAPFTLGIISWYMSVVRAVPQRFSGAFIFYENGRRYWRAVWYSVSMSIRVTLWALLFFLLPFAVMGGTIGLTQRFSINGNHKLAVFSAMGMILAVLLLLLALFLYLAYMNKYFLVSYLLASDPDISVRLAVKRSVQITHEHRFSLLWYGLSFTGWFLLTLVCPPLLLYTVPYTCASLAMYAQYLIESYHHEQKQDEYTREFSPEAHIATTEANSSSEETAPIAVKPEAFPASNLPLMQGEIPPAAQIDIPPNLPNREEEIISPEPVSPLLNPESSTPGGDNPPEQTIQQQNGQWPYI